MSQEPPTGDNVSSDFIFGTMATDARRLGYLRAELAGVSHRHRIEPLDPEPGQPVTLSVTLGPAVAADRLTIYYTTDGAAPGGRRGAPDPGTFAVACERLASVWDTLLWAYTEEWQGTIPPQPIGTTVRYRIEAWSTCDECSAMASEIVGSTAGDGTVLGDVGPGDTNLRELGREFSLTFVRGARTFAYRVDEERTPAWLRDAIIYHVFVDRFAPGGGRSFATPATPMGFYGGTLAGVTEQIDYIAALGVGAIWLSPIFPSPSHHGYDATDYFSVEPRLGTGAELRALLAAAHARGIRVLLDYTANHFSSSHPVFQSALRDPASPYRDWFTFTSYPDTYVSFFGVADLPQINSDHPAARRFMIEPALYWLQQGVDGFRLDYTIGPSHAFWTDFRAATRAARADSATMGEAVDTAEILRSYTGRFDGCLDFLLLQALRLFFAFGELRPSQFATFLQRHLSAFPPGLLMPSFLDNHDMNRFLWVSRGDVRRLKLAALCQYTLPHPPIVYYGTEAGLSQERDVRHPDGSGHPEESRLPMLWGEAQNDDLLAFYRRLGALRRETAQVWRGPRRTIFLDDARGHLGHLCGEPGAEHLVAINNGPADARIALPDGRCSLAFATTADAAVSGATLSLPAYGGAVLRQG
ncbi:MAG: alpha-amylase [Chloroflexales bacterium]|nr:alpha-amylase [Chloroflexales bacterium]